MDIEHYRDQLPYFNFNIRSKRFSGFAGCNQVNGTLFSEHQLLRFIKITQTRMLCAPPNKENVILSALAKVTTYKIEGCPCKLTQLIFHFDKPLVGSAM